MAARIGFINIGHPDYPNEVGERFAARAMDALRDRGILPISDGIAHTDPGSAASRGLEMAGERLDGVIVWLGTWVEASTAVAAIREIEHLPLAVWTFGMHEENGRRESTGSFVAGCVMKGALDRMGYRFTNIIGFPDDPKAYARAVDFSLAAHALQQLKRTRIGLVGYASMSMYPGTFDHLLLRRHIGPEVVHFDTYTLVRLAERLDFSDLRGLIDGLTAGMRIEVDAERLAKPARLYGALRRLADRHALHALNVKCQYELSQEWGMTACVPLSRLADEGLVCACEGDVMLSATQCMLAALTGDTVTYGDILDVTGDTMLLSACGFAPTCLAKGARETTSECPAAVIRELDYPGFDGVISSCVLEQGSVTFARLVEGRGDYRLVYGTGTGVETDLRQGRFPALNVRLDGDPQRLLDAIASQHFALCYGDVSSRLEELCGMLGIASERV